MIKVSVIVPVYNVEKYLKKCLDSLVNQTLREIEIIVINDGSLDNSQKIIDNYVKKYPNTIKSFIKENGGLSDARNYGIKKAAGEYIAFVDSDDWVELNTLELMYKEAKKDGSSIVICDIIDHYVNDFTIYHNYTKFDFKYQNPSSVCNKIFKRDLIGDLRFYKGIWYEDLNFTTKLLSITDKISTVAKGLYHYNIREGSTMNNSNALKNLDILISLDDLNEYLLGRGVLETKDIITYLVFNDVLIGSINRVAKQNVKYKKFVIKKLTTYCRKNINKDSLKKYKKYFSKNARIIAYLNYIGLSNVSKLLLIIKQNVKGNNLCLR